MATAPILPLAWEPPYATGAALKKKERERDCKDKWEPSQAGREETLVRAAQKLAICQTDKTAHVQDDVETFSPSSIHVG